MFILIKKNLSQLDVLDRLFFLVHSSVGSMFIGGLVFFPWVRFKNWADESTSRC